MTGLSFVPRELLGFVLAATVFVAASPVAAASEWHASDRFGVVRDPIAEDELDDYEYAVFVERSGTTETQTLHFAGEPIRRSVIEYAGWGDVEPRPARRIVTEDGELVATEHFRYWADGSLRSVRTVGARGATVEYRYLLGRLHEEWVQSSDAVDRTTYDRLGRILGRTRWEADEIVERETRTYWGESAADTVKEIAVVVDGVETLRRYDEAGRLLGTSTARAGAVESDRTRVFEGDLLVEEREQSDGVERVWRYEYEDDMLAVERYFEDDDLVKLTDYSHEDYTRIETLYRGGEPALRVYFRGQSRVIEEVIRDGEIVRTRDFEDTP
ncbi:MAG: hypothetical protein ACOC7V_13030 [Spirochaetota bacterium]